MKERPILFSGPMVRALLDGAKTQTRRTTGLDHINLDPSQWHIEEFRPGDLRFVNDFTGEITLINNALSSRPYSQICPYGWPGDRLWVKETHADLRVVGKEEHWVYRADPEWDGFEASWKWKPSIHMPRRASRITLEITAVRVERLQDIIEDDAKSEGVEHNPLDPSPHLGQTWRDYLDPINNYGCGHAKGSYYTLWESINGPSSWDLNPWVWVIEFKVVSQ